MAGDGTAELRAFGDKLERILGADPVRRVLVAGAKAGKAAALDAVSATLGGDRKFSHWKGKPALSAGYDDPIGASSEVQINMRPTGLWRLAEDGRRTAGAIYPKTGRGRSKRGTAKRAVKVNGQLVARSRYGSSRGLGTYTRAERTAGRTVPAAAGRQFSSEVHRALGH